MRTISFYSEIHHNYPLHTKILDYDIFFLDTSKDQFISLTHHDQDNISQQPQSASQPTYSSSQPYSYP